MKIYLAHPITGLTREEVVGYYQRMTVGLESRGYVVLCPMTGKGDIRVEKEYRATGYEDIPAATNHAIFERDKWMVEQCDVLLCDLSDKSERYIGCIMELAWGSLLGKHTILVMPEDSEYRHAFMLEAADVCFVNLLDALDYLRKLSKGAMT